MNIDYTEEIQRAYHQRDLTSSPRTTNKSKNKMLYIDYLIEKHFHRFVKTFVCECIV